MGDIFEMCNKSDRNAILYELVGVVGILSGSWHETKVVISFCQRSMPIYIYKNFEVIRTRLVHLQLSQC